MTMTGVVWACWVVFVLAAITISAVQWRKLRYRERAMRDWPHVQAVVVGSSTSANRVINDELGARNSYVNEYEYLGTDGARHRGSTIWDTHRPFPIGHVVTVCVNPARPSESYLVEKVNRAQLGGAMALLGVFTLASFYFVRLLTQS